MSGSRPFFATTSRNYDYPPGTSEPTVNVPPASNNLPPHPADSISAQLERGEQLWSLFEEQASRVADMSTSPDRRRRMRSILSRLQDMTSENNRRLSANTDSSSSSSSSRRIAAPGSRFRRRIQDRTDSFSRLRSEVVDSAQDSMAQLREAGDRLSQVNADLRNLLDQPLVGTETSNIRTGTRIHERIPLGNTEGGDRRKRRRVMDSVTFERGNAQIAYGYEGQVVTTRLKMEIVSSDGGIMDPNTGNYDAKNILRDDLSVYCTKSSRCNMVLCHEGEASFCLEKLTIKAPRTGYTDPVQEGLVYVSMKKDEKFERTVRHRVNFDPTNPYHRLTPGLQRLTETEEVLSRVMMVEPPPPRRGLPVSDAWRVLSGTGPETSTTDPVDCYDSEEEDADHAANEMQDWLTPGITFESPQNDSTVNGPGITQPNSHLPPERPPPQEPLRFTRGEFMSISLPSGIDQRQRPRSPSTAAHALAIDAGVNVSAPPIWAQPSSSSFRATEDREYYASIARGEPPSHITLTSQNEYDEIIRRGNLAASDRRRRRRERLDRERERARVHTVAAAAAARSNLSLPPVSTAMDLLPPHAPPLDSNPLEMLEPVARFSMRRERRKARREDRERWRDFEYDSAEEAYNSDHDFETIFNEPAHTDSQHQNQDPFSETPEDIGKNIQTHQSFSSTVTSHNLTITFSPPLSARYVLLKLWSPKRDREGNIDIQGVEIEGTAGPRFFAAMDMR